MTQRWLPVLLCLFLAGPAVARAQSPLPTSQASATTTAAAPAEYRFTAPEPGLLTVIVRGDGADLVLLVTDADGQVLGRSDDDLRGDLSAEQLAVAVGAPGEYGVIVEPRFDQGAFRIASAFIPFAELATEPDPDGAPGRAREVSVNESLEDSIDPSGGDAADWFVFRPPSAGTVTIATRGEGRGDIVLELYEADSFREEAGRSDQDLQGDNANESVTLAARANEPIYARVGSFSESADETPYRLVVVFIAD